MRVIKTYDPGGTVSPTRDTPTTEHITEIDELSKITDLTIRNPSSDSNGIPTYLATAMRKSLCKANPEMKLHRRMYKDATIRTNNLGDSSEIEIKDVLFDTGASHSSYISKELVDIT